MKTKQAAANAETQKVSICLKSCEDHGSMMVGAIQDATPILRTVTMLLNSLVDEAYSKAGSEAQTITLGQAAIEAIADTLSTVCFRLEQAEAGPGAETTKAA